MKNPRKAKKGEKNKASAKGKITNSLHDDHGPWMAAILTCNASKLPDGLACSDTIASQAANPTTPQPVTLRTSVWFLVA